MDVEKWIRRAGGIAHRSDLRARGWESRRLRGLERIGRSWIVVGAPAPALVEAARHHARLACVSAAQHLGLELLTHPGELHLWVPATDRHSAPVGVRLHRSLPIMPVPRTALVESVPDLLSHVATCLPEVEALIVWESAVRRGHLSVEELRSLSWPGPRQRRLSRLANGLSDSLLETLLADQLRTAGLPYRQQERFLGRPVDFLIGRRLIVQVDGYQHHQAAQRRSDIAFDAQLKLRGEHVLRFDYEQVVANRAVPVVLQAYARGLHR